MNVVNRTCAVLTLIAFCALPVSSAGTYGIAYAFGGGTDGSDPASSLTFDANGDAYGTTVTGGAYGCGTVYKLSRGPRDRWVSTVLHAFGCAADGKNPHGGVALHGGRLYGTTVAGGPGGVCNGDGCGEAYEVSENGFSVLYGFTGGADGFGPGSALTFDARGRAFGTTPDGGKYGAGTIFELVRDSSGWRKVTLHDFTGKRDGGIGSLGAPLLDAAGNVYGVTEIGGASGAGTAYELVRGAGESWRFKLLYAFRGTPDAGSPYGGLIADARGHLLGTTYYGGATGKGTLYELTPAARGAWNERVLYSFRGGRDGALPTSTPALDATGTWYVTTSAGGVAGCDCGTVVAFDPASRKERVVHAFGSSPDGAYAYYGLTSDGRGTYFSTTVAGGTHGRGTVFALKP